MPFLRNVPAGDLLNGGGSMNKLWITETGGPKSEVGSQKPEIGSMKVKSIFDIRYQTSDFRLLISCSGEPSAVH